MTISKTQLKKKIVPVNLQLSGSQINLSPRPMPAAHVTWSSNYKTFPIRRSISAFGFQQKNEHTHVKSRPQSADNIRHLNRINAANDFQSEIAISASHQDLNQNCILSENIFENIINDYSESKLISHHSNVESNLKPGLSTKPPLPPSPDSKATKMETEPDNLIERSENIKTAAEKEAFDEIIALKFQRWFPNSTFIEGTSSEDETNDVELLSYKERNYQTCEYRYEIRKNKKITNEKKTQPILRTKKNKKILTKKDKTDSAELKTNRVLNVSEKIDDRSISILEEQDYKQISQKLDKTEKSKCQEEKLKKTSSLKKSNFQSPQASPFKKQKKISFSVDKKDDDPPLEKSKDFVEPYLTSKNSEIDKTITVADKNGIDDHNDVKNNSNQIPNRDMTISPQQPAGSQIEDVLSWMGAHSTMNNKLNSSETELNNSMYEEIVGILKDIEKEDIKDESKLTDLPSSRNPTPSSPAKAIWSLIEEAERNSDIINNTGVLSSTTDNNRAQDIHLNARSTHPEEKNWNRLSDLLQCPSTELAQKVMALQLLLEERETALRNLNSRLKQIEQTDLQRKQEFEYTIHKQQKLIEQLKNDKKTTTERYENSIKELEKKHTSTLISLDEKHKIEMKKNLEKQAASDKLERDKWMETKTQKIKELAIKGLEPELNRMAAAHQEEIAEIRRFHKREIEEIEEALNRRMSVQKEKMEADKEKALAIEREISRQKLEDEIGELEKRYQEQRKRLLAEVHVERENMERENEATLAIKEKENERKWEKKSIEMQKKIESLHTQHQDEIKKLHQNFEAEKQIWMKNQMIELSEKENKIKEQYKKERDKHIELIIQKLESENTEREQTAEQKIKRIKEQYEIEIHDVEMVNENLRRKLNETRSEIQKTEDIISQLRAQLNQSQTEYMILKEKHDRLLIEQGEMQNMAKSELTTKIHILQSELNQAQLTYESQIKSLKSENERELSQMYSRVKEMILKKDDLINTLKKQKDAALQQCSQLEKLLDLKRKDHLRS